MKARYKGPAGTGILEIPDDATVQALFKELSTKAGISKFTLKYGPPMAMKTLDLTQKSAIARSLGLHGETLTIVPDEARELTPPPAHAEEKSNSTAQKNEGPEYMRIPWPERGGALLLRVMPSDNSCLFTAFGGALSGQIPAQQLRRMMADYIKEHSDVYSEAVLGCPPREYCRSIQDPDRWGGGIELSILSSIFDIQICTFDVQAQNLMKFGEDKDERCILVYSGIHYDRVAFTLSSQPHPASALPPELDVTIWSTHDDEVLGKAQELVQKLNAAHYYTDTDGLILKCDVPGCEWIGSGQLEGQKHAQQTGHYELTEIRDIEGDNVLKKCESSRCDFIGQGDRAVRQHRADTGHERFSVIPDW